jgi:hypothetical protein
LVFARSRRPTYVFAAFALALAAALLGAGAWFVRHGSGWAALIAAMLAGVALAVLTRMIRRLRHWPPSRLGLFADRLVMVQGPVEMQAPWELVEWATLASAQDAEIPGWSELRLTDRLRVGLRQGRTFSLRPAVFGLEAEACRDLVLRLRDDPSLRARLPEFDSMLDLENRPPHTGGLTHSPL